MTGAAPDDAGDGNGNGPTRHLFDAILSTDRAGVAGLLADDPAAVHRWVDGVTALHVACHAVTADNAIPAQDGGPVAHAIVDDLLGAGADVGARSPDGYTPLHSAAFCGNVELVGQLLAAGADSAATVDNIPGSTPLSFALFYANPEAGRLLAEVARHPDDLRSAAALDDRPGVERFLAAGGGLVPGADAGMAFTAPIGAFPARTGPITEQLTLDESLTWASRNGALTAMASLVAAGADIDANPYRGTPLLWAIYSERLDAARWLLARGADVDHRHDFGGAEHGRQATALHLAAQFGSLASIELLLEAGADRTIRDGAFNATPREWAEHGGQAAAVARLTQA